MDVLKGKRALVTGAASGIGRAIAEVFGREGAAVAVVDLNPAGQATAEAVGAAGGQAMFVRADVTRMEDCRRAVDEAEQAFGGLELLVNCAGVIRRANVLGTTEEEWERVMAVNAKSVFLMASAPSLPWCVRAGA